MAESVKPSRRTRVLRITLSVVACVLLLGGAGGASYLIVQSEPTAQREGATRTSAALVETVSAERGTFRPRLDVLGRVEPARDIVLSPRVSGQITLIEPGLVPGGTVEAGQNLVQIDPADFEQVLTTRQSEMRQVESELAIEQGRQEVAQREFELLGEDIGTANRALVLREPQIAAIRARLLAAEAAVRRAELDLERTSIQAPFDAQVLTRSVNVGSQVAPGDPIARLIGIDEYWVIASVPLRDLRWLRVPRPGEEGSIARVRHSTAWEPGASRTGQVTQLIGTVDQQTRLARVLITVADPLGRESGDPPLILDTIVQVEIEAQPIEDVVRIDRDLLRQNDSVWVMQDGELQIRDVEVVFSDAEYAYLSSGVEEGEQIVVTNLATVVDGLPLRTEAESPSGREADDSDPESTP